MKHLKRINEGVNMPSIFRKQVVYSVDSDRLANLIRKTYGRSPEIEASLELGHDDTFEISACASDFVNDDGEDEFAKWLKKPQYSHSEIHMLMNKLAYDEIIVDGDYLIKVL